MVLICGALPDAALAANTVIFNIWGVLWSVFWGIGLATIVRSGKTISNGDIAGTKLVIRISFVLSVVINGIIAVLCYFFRTQMAMLYTSSDDVIEILEHSIPVLAALFFVGGMGWSACSAMEGMARNTERSLVYSVTAWLMFVPGAIYLGLYSPWSKMVCLCSLRSDWICGVQLESLFNAFFQRQISKNSKVRKSESPKIDILLYSLRNHGVRSCSFGDGDWWWK